MPKLKVIEPLFENIIKEFINVVNPLATRIEALPSIILVFGGKKSVKIDEKYISCRNVFLDWAFSTNHELSKFLKTPEDYPEWNNFEGYQNLIEFERDAGSLSSCILLFSESYGAIAELGAFSMDETLCERLLVVVDKKHHPAISFVSLGPIKLLQAISEDSVFVVESIKDKNSFESELTSLAEALVTKFASIPKTQTFTSTRSRDQLLLIADLVELFGAITKKELKELIEFMGVAILPTRFNQMLNQLKLFDLINQQQKGNQIYLVAPTLEKRKNYLNYVAQHGQPNFDRTRTKLKIHSELKSDALRFKAYQQANSS